MFSMKDKVMEILESHDFAEKRSSKLDINEFLQYALFCPTKNSYFYLMANPSFKATNVVPCGKSTFQLIVQK